MDCEKAKTLVPGYLDGELSEEQASPLRQHLMECAGCRVVVQDEKSLKDWFVQEAAPSVPEGFAARVARRAMAGDTGEHDVLTPVAPPAAKSDNVLNFVMQLTAMAATLLIALSIGIGGLRLPQGEELQAEEGTSLQEAFEELDELNRAEKTAEPAEATPVEGEGD